MPGLQRPGLFTHSYLFMISEQHIIEVRLSASEMAFLKRQAAKAEIGGKSHVRGADRQDKLRQDQLVGLMGHFAAIRALFGSSWLFQLQRHFAGVYPLDSDGGADCPGARLDVKSSLITKPNLLDYRLPVRPRERHNGMVYLLALVELEPRPTAHLVGWCTAEMLPDKPATDGPFSGAYVIGARELHPIMPLRWFQEPEPPQRAAATHTATITTVSATDIQW